MHREFVIDALPFQNRGLQSTFTLNSATRSALERHGRNRRVTSSQLGTLLRKKRPNSEGSGAVKGTLSNWQRRECGGWRRLLLLLLVGRGEGRKTSTGQRLAGRADHQTLLRLLLLLARRRCLAEHSQLECRGCSCHDRHLLRCCAVRCCVWLPRRT